MYLPQPNGSVEVIQGYECQLPPIGYGVNRFTGEQEWVGVRSVSTKQNDQVWKPLSLPKDWDKKRKKEIEKQKLDPEYFDTELEKIRNQWWHHRICGDWIKINGKDTYIPPSYWFYLTCCPLDVGLPTYRDTDRKFFYSWEYCIADPRCGGLVDIERRRQGKTFKSGSILLDRASIFPNHVAGIQSKTSSDAKQVFLKTVVNFFKKMPDFFRPIYDQSKGMTPSTELRFYRTVIKGKKADDLVDGAELESMVNWGSSELYHYDGQKLSSYLCDEFGKTELVDVYDRWNVARYCLDQDGQWCGKAIFTSTIEDITNVGDGAKKIWDNSDPTDRDANGRTKTGMYRFFLPAYETTLFDKFGMPRAEEAKVYYMNQREGLKNDTRALSSMIRKNPFTIQEAFRIDGSESLYNAQILNERRDVLSWATNLNTRGNLVWKDGVRDTEVEWKADANGRFRMYELPKENANKVKKSGNAFFPENNLKYVIGADPFSHDTTKDKRRSNGAAGVYKKPNSGEKDKTYQDAFVCEYLARPDAASIYYEDMIKMCFYFGCQILFENNKNNWKQYFIDRGYHGFLMYLPGNTEPGVHANASTHQELAEATEEYINNYSEKIYSMNWIEDCLKFDIQNTTAFDTAMAFGYALLATKKKLYRDTAQYARPITDYIRKYKVA